MKKMMNALLALMLVILLMPCAAQAEFVDHTERYPDKFLAAGEAPIRTENSYQSQDVNLTINTQRLLGSDVYVVDIYVRSVESFQRVFAGGSYGKTTAKVQKMATENDAIVAMTGDSGHYFTVGWAVGNGEVLRDTKNRKRDLGILYRDGVMVTVENDAVDYDQLRADADADRIWQLFLFGPALLDAEGKAKTDFKDSNVRFTNPRSAIGYFAPGHYCFVQVDGRGTKSQLAARKSNSGMTLNELADFMASLGCMAAYNLDGGQSSMLAFNDKIISAPVKGGRRVGDIVIIKDLLVQSTETSGEEAK